jgi:glycosyltransferase involved in cell wall biosynthesis
MNSLSIITPIYNEEKLLTRYLSSVSEYPDELVIVDGGPSGASTDKSKKIIESFNNPKIKYISGTFGMAGLWDKSEQINRGIRESSGTHILVLSADTYIEGDLSIGDFPNIPVAYFDYRQFWLDTHSLRFENGHISRLGSVISKELRPRYKNGQMITIAQDSILPEDTIFIPAIIYHCGWIRSFREQVEKHIRNVRMGGWDEKGLKLMQKGERALEAWSLHHVLHYKETGYIPCGNVVPFEMSYMDGIDEYIKEYETKHKEEFYVGIMRNVPHDLL